MSDTRQKRMSACVPHQPLVAAAGSGARESRSCGFFRPCEQVDEMLSAEVNQRRHRPPVGSIEPAAHERESLVTFRT